jgi:hypothetical protein
MGWGDGDNDSWMWWYIAVISTLGRLRQEDCELKTTPDYTVRTSLKKKEKIKAEHWWLTPVVQATREVEIRRIVVQSQPGQIVCKTLSQNYATKK